MNNRNYYRYEFYKRLDGSKHRMNIEAIVDLIESKSKGEKKQLEASIHGTVIVAPPGQKAEVNIGIKAVNKSERPIVIKMYYIDVPKEEKKVGISPFHPEHLMKCSQLPWRS